MFSSNIYLGFRVGGKTPALPYNQRIVMKTNEYPKGLPENLKIEYEKYIKDPKRYKKLYPVCYRILSKYIGAQNG